MANKNINDIVDLARNYKSSNYENGIRTVLTTEMLKNIAEISLQNSELDGDIAEIGVWRGSVGIIFGEIFTDKNIYLFDTFEGIPYSNQYDNVHRAGDFGRNDRDPLYYTDFNEVKDTLSIYKNIYVYKGVFPEENSEHIFEKKFAIVHLDVDVYQSYKDSLEFFYPKMIKNGLILFDDYGIPSCEGATKAVNDFCESKNIKIEKFNNLHYITNNYE